MLHSISNCKHYCSIYTQTSIESNLVEARHVIFDSYKTMDHRALIQFLIENLHFIYRLMFPRLLITSVHILRRRSNFNHYLKKQLLPMLIKKTTNYIIVYCGYLN